MPRGKYGAKAANRLAAFDNELLARKTAEADQLKAQVAELRAGTAQPHPENCTLTIWLA